MSEASEGSPVAVEQAAGPSAGTLVRQAREAAGLQVDALAVALKVTVKQIEALEADRWDLLPDAVFARALAASICRNLRIDPAPVLARLPQAAPRLSPGGAGLNEPFRTSNHGSGPDIGAYLSRPVVLGVLALMLGALVLVLLPVPKDAASDEVSAQGAPAAAPAAPASAVAGVQLLSEVVPAPAASAPVVAGPVSAPVATPAPASPPVVSVATPAPAVAPAAAASAVAASADGVLSFSASADSWIKVTDARGAVVLSRLLKPGESAGASGALPLSVVVGRADATRVQLRGRPMDLGPLTRENIARFEVK